METVGDKLRLLCPAISEIPAISGVPFLSLAVLHQGKIIHTAHFGKSRHIISLPYNETIYRIAPLIKVITACATALLVKEGIFSWYT
jgi:CubicO group peptidase (beta-lactamase class C family)